MSNVETKLTQELPESVLATLAEIGEEINASLNLDRVLSKMATLIKRLIDYEIFTVMLLDERSQMLFNRFAVGYSQEMMENWRIPMGQGISGAAAASRQPIRSATFATIRATSMPSTAFVPSLPCRCSSRIR